MGTVKRVLFALAPPVQILDVAGPFEVFARCGGYAPRLVTSEPREKGVVASCGILLSEALPYTKVRGPVDTLVVPGGAGAELGVHDDGFLRWITRTSARCRRTASVCTGAFVLARCGLLDGRRAVTHWDWCERLAAEFPRVIVERDPIFIRDRGVYTSAGVTAGIDLALSMVAEDHGSARANEIARDLVMFVRRGGGQSQFSDVLSAQDGGGVDSAFEGLHGWIVNRLRGDLSVEALAARCGMSPRHFARVFAATMSVTPAKYVERVRVASATAMIRESRSSLKEIAHRCGFGSVDTMRRSFLRIASVAPSHYRRHFGSEGVER